MESLIEVVRDIVSDPDLVTEAQRRIYEAANRPDHPRSSMEAMKKSNRAHVSTITSTHIVTESDDELDTVVIESACFSESSNSPDPSGPCTMSKRFSALTVLNGRASLTTTNAVFALTFLPVLSLPTVHIHFVVSASRNIF